MHVHTHTHTLTGKEAKRHGVERPAEDDEADDTGL
jgi:hypothetical protein